MEELTFEGQVDSNVVVGSQHTGRNTPRFCGASHAHGEAKDNFYPVGHHLN